MNLKILILSVSIFLLAPLVFADRAIAAAAATQLGYDLSSETGRKQFGDYLKTQRDTLAKSSNADLSTEDGRKKFGDSMKAHVDAVAKTQGFDMTTKEGRDSLEKYLVSTGDLSYLRPGPTNRELQMPAASRGPSQGGDQTQVAKPDCAGHPAAAASTTEEHPRRPTIKQQVLAQQQRH